MAQGKQVDEHGRVECPTWHKGSEAEAKAWGALDADYAAAARATAPYPSYSRGSPTSTFQRSSIMSGGRAIQNVDMRWPVA